METLAQKIVELLKGPDPPQTVAELVSRTGNKPAAVYSKISGLLNTGALMKSDLPWRRGIDSTGAGRPRKNSLKSLKRKLEKIIDEGAGDRVAAIKELRDLMTVGSEQFGPPPPDDRIGIVRELSRQMEAAGRDVCAEALEMAYPTSDTLESQEAVNGQEDANVAAVGVGGGNLG